ncbi:N-acetyl-gamma-glutamyl-phosphate reductase [Chlorobium phaeovibrioides]|uniref:N-acetyl-gamma-glutamyl-phosphate reductase n=1 Tax=Chlorobium phaeovibrioides TaxID=1094 RepID=A0A432AXI1_CHLPH|nr:N-acetyl-gamma-glutamyl-phosphate reductase [Chlorobium phaeovibrioides]RTY39989.1 N-acetyl-gamma-glutamyl-phosphate reductase [Chlorobium phaeovibrioides]
MTASKPMDSAAPTVSVIGASGYSGAELTRLLQRHQGVKLQHLYAFSQAGKRADDLYPATGCPMTYLPYEGGTQSDIYFLALPHGEAHTLVPALAAAGKKVIDLSGDFRLKSTQEHEAFYGSKKPAEAVMTYAMPELFKEEIASATTVSNPGCYATSIILALAPLFKGAGGMPKVNSVACTAISGLSGAGRSSKTELSFAEMSENVRAYKVGKHQHTPEIMQALGTSYTDPSFAFTFTPMIGSLVRGIYSTLTLSLDSPAEAQAIRARYAEFYQGAPFVRVRNEMTEVRHVAHTNFCDIHIPDSGRSSSLVVISAIDNLLKGAAGQAVQNMNIMLGLDERTGLL